MMASAKINRASRKLIIALTFILSFFIYSFMRDWTRSIPTTFSGFINFLTLSIPFILPGLILGLATLDNSIIERNISQPWVACWIVSSMLFPSGVTIMFMVTAKSIACYSQFPVCSTVLRFLIMAGLGMFVHLVFTATLRPLNRSLLKYVVSQGLVYGVASWILVEVDIFSIALLETTPLSEMGYSLRLISLGVSTMLAFLLADNFFLPSEDVAPVMNFES